MESLKYLLELDKSSRQSIVAKAYYQIIKASAGLGTDVDAILAAIKLINTPQEFDQLLKLFKDKKTGYDSFQNMINGEYDSLNYNDVVNIVNKLKSIGVIATFASSNPAGRFKIFNGNFKIIKIHPSIDRLKLENKWRSLLPKAIKFWRDWLAHPETQKKVYRNYLLEPMGKKNVLKAFLSYEAMLQNLKLEFYDKDDVLTPITKVPVTDGAKNAYGFVRPFENLRTVYINCTEPDPDAYGTLIHEIQHIIYHIKPLNPDMKIRNTFVSNNTVKATEKSIKSSLDRVFTINKDTGHYELRRPIPNMFGTEAEFKQMIQGAKSQNSFLETQDVVYWATRFLGLSSGDSPTYICSETELGSVITRMKELFGLKPDTLEFPVKLLIPYIKLDEIEYKTKKNNTDIMWFLSCWVKKGFPNLENLLKQINQLAINKTKTSSSNSTTGKA